MRWRRGEKDVPNLREPLLDATVDLICELLEPGSHDGHPVVRVEST